jgi:L-arabinose isomerase
MGEANAAMARTDRKVGLVKRAESLVPIRGSQLALATVFEPGDATLMALTVAEEQRWRIISSPISIVDFGPLDQLAVPHTKARFPGDVRGFLTSYATAGGPHHLAICFGDARRKLEILADLMDADYCEVQ